MYVAAKVQIKIEKSLICVKNKAVCAHNSQKSLERVKNRRTFAPSKDIIQDNSIKVGADQHTALSKEKKG